MEIPEKSVQMHDKYQVEVKFTYPVDTSHEMLDYKVETYMFIPNNLCINKATYSKDEFYSDIQKYIRFKTPVMHLREMNGAEKSPLARLESSIRKLLASMGDDLAEQEYFDSVKIFCSMFKSALRDEEIFIEKSAESPDFRQLLDTYLEKSSEVLAKFRSLRMLILSPHLPERQVKMFGLADEFASLTVNKYRYRLINFLKSGKDHYGIERIVELAASEIKHRIENSYPSIPASDSDNEEFVYRESALKKVMASVLFIKKRTVVEGRFLEQISFGIAAGLAMAFATGTALAFRCRLDEFSMTFFIILVVSYMFKDRIKELSRLYMLERLRKYLYDFRTDLFNSFDKKTGFCQESFTFLAEKELPDDIVKLRNKDYLSELENGVTGEDIIYSKKQINLHSRECSKIFSGFRVDGVVDIMRFNIRNFLEKMDNPVKEIYMPGGEDIITMKGKRVYHVNMIMKYGMAGCGDVFHRFRLVLSRNGIRRIEEIL